MRNSLEQIMDSIKNKLFNLPYTTTVLPGHGQITTLAEEMSRNPYVKVYNVCLNGEYINKQVIIIMNNELIRALI